MRLQPGTRLGPYEIVAALGAGGMGEVYQARDTRLDRDVAVKILPEAVASDPDRLARFEREAKTVAAINHPNIVTLFAVEDIDGVRFLVMELIVGENLETMVSRGRMSAAAILDLAVPLADALAAAHEKAIVHRDLKPGNVMISEEGRLKILDFGLAKPVATEGEPSNDSSATLTAAAPLSLEGHRLGTAPYMAPEQVRGESVDARTDIFALGVILYEMATGRRPFTGRTTSDLISSILRDEPPSLRDQRPDLPPAFDEVVERCLAKNPADRYSSAAQARDVLQAVRDGALTTGVASKTPRARHHRAARRAVFFSVTAVLAAMVGIAGYRYWMAHRPTLSRPGTTTASVSHLASIAVLPFVDLSPRHDQDYFAEGISEELLNVLAGLRDVRVAARTSSFSFKSKEVQIPDVGRQLHVEHVLEGSVRKAGRRYRITAQLVKSADGFHVWSQTYDLELGDVFMVQDSIAHSVVRELRTALYGAGHPSATTDGVAAAYGRGTNPEAYRLTLEARFFYDRFNQGDMAKAVALYRQALKLDPNSAIAWAGLSRAYMAQASWAWTPMPDSGYANARASAQRSLDLAPDLAEGHVALGWVSLWHDWNWVVADSSYHRALRLAPGNADVLHAVAGASGSLGHLDEAIALDRRAAELDPLSVPALRNWGSHAYQAGRLDEAEAALRKGLELGPQNGFLSYGLGLVSLAKKRAPEARAFFEKVPVDYYRLQGLALAGHLAGDSAASNASLRQLIREHSKDAPFQIAATCAYRGQADEAFRWLDRAYEARDPGLVDVRIEPLLRPLHRDPRWKALLHRMGFAA